MLQDQLPYIFYFYHIQIGLFYNDYRNYSLNASSKECQKEHEWKLKELKADGIFVII